MSYRDDVKDMSVTKKDIKDSKDVLNTVFYNETKKTDIVLYTERLYKAIYFIVSRTNDSHSLQNLESASDEVLSSIVSFTVTGSIKDFQRAIMSLIAAKAQVGVLVAKGQFTEGNGTLISLALDTLMRELSALRPSNVPPQLTFERQPAIETTLPLQGPLGERRAVARSEGKIRRAERTTRKEEILSILRGVAPMNIKEVASKMGNVSEKTVQRELSDLIAEGAVLREGERRWSSYKLATND